MAITKKDLQNHVDHLNNKYCKNTKNKLVIHQAYGGYQVMLTGKTYNRGNKTFYRKGSLRSSGVEIGNTWHDSAKNTLVGLYKAESKGWLQSQIKWRDKN